MEREERLAKRREYMRAYKAKPENKLKRKLYDAKYTKRPEVQEAKKAYSREYNKRPYVRKRRYEYQLKYLADPENRRKRNEYAKNNWRKYRSDPEVYAKIIEYNQVRHRMQQAVGYLRRIRRTFKDEEEYKKYCDSVLSKIAQTDAFKEFRKGA